MSKVIIGTELKLNVNIQPIDGKSMSDYDFDIQLRGGKNTISFEKRRETISDGLAKDEDSNDNYIVAFNTKDLGIGRVVCRVIAYLEDGAFNYDDHKRTEITEVNTGIEVVKTLV